MPFYVFYIVYVYDNLKNSFDVNNITPVLNTTPKTVRFLGKYKIMEIIVYTEYTWVKF